MSWLLVLCARPGNDPPATPSGASTGQESSAPEESRWKGEITLGLRLVDVDGSQAQFDEDRNLDSGLFVRDFGLEGELPPGSGPIDRFLLRAAGIGDPNTHVRLETVGGPWRTVGLYERNRFAGNAQVDLRSFDVTRDTGSLTLEYAPERSESRSSLDVSYVHRDGVELGSRSVGFSYVSGFPVRQDEKDLSALGRWKTRFGELGVDLALGVDQTQSRDRYDYTLATPLFPSDPVSEDFAADVDGQGRRGELRLERAFDGGRLRVDAGLDWHAADRRGDLASSETAFSFVPTLPFVRDTQGDLESEQSDLQGDAGVVFQVGDSTDLELRYTRSHEEESGDLLDTVILDDLSGNPPTVTQSPSSSDFESRSSLFELALTSAPTTALSLDLSLEWSREQLHVLEVVEDVTTRFFDGSVDDFGAQGSVSVELGRTTSATLAGGHVRRPTENAEPGVEFVFADERSSYVELEGRWRPVPDTTFSAKTRYEHQASEAFDSTADVLRGSLSFNAVPASSWDWNGALVYETYAREAQTNFLFFDPGTGFTLVPGEATFDGIERVLSTSTSYEVIPAFAPRASASAALSSGDSSFGYLTVALALPWSVSQELELGVDLQWLDFDGDALLDDADYRATVLEIYVRKGFGR